MKKQPKLVLRESCISDAIHSWPAGTFVEMGAGTGYMTRWFLEKGFTGACHDLGADSREAMRENLAFAEGRIRVVDSLDQLLPGSFDYLLAFEVLEHIEDDLDVFRGWMRYLKPGGRVLLSVPAHARKFGRSDEIVGHVRRYEKQQLKDLLVQSGVEDVEVVNYGYPVTEATRRVSNWMIRGDRSYDALTPEQRSIKSAQAKPKAVSRALSLYSEKWVAPFCIVQRWFYRWDLGDGYVAWGRKAKG